MKKLLNIIFILLLPMSLYASEITSISTSTFSDNQEISFEGTGFLTHSLDIEWLGGKTGYIESGTPDTVFAKTGWSVDPDCTEITQCGTKASRYNSDKKHSGSNSIISIIKDGAGFCPNYLGGGVDNCIQSGYSFDGTTAGGYFTYWVYFEEFANSDGQWKMWRYMLGSGYRDVDTTVESSQWYLTDESNKQAYLTTLYPMGTNPSTEYTSELIIPQKTWCRVEVNIVPGNPGSIFYRVYNGGIVTEFFNKSASIDGAAFRYPFQNLWGNHQIAPTYSSDAEISMDDHYLQDGTQARVEIVDTLNWADRTHAEIQLPTVWDSAGTDITFTANQGSFPTGTAYLFVVSSDGTVSDQDGGTAGEQGLEVTISAATSTATTGISTEGSSTFGPGTTTME